MNRNPRFPRAHTIVRMVRVLLSLALLLLIGCSHRPRDLSSLPRTDLAESFYLATVKANAIPPQGWTRQPLRQSANHPHETFLSPTGDTAYGIIHFTLPLPMGPDIALWGFLREMRNTEGEACLLYTSDAADERSSVDL